MCDLYDHCLAAKETQLPYAVLVYLSYGTTLLLEVIALEVRELVFRVQFHTQNLQNEFARYINLQFGCNFIQKRSQVDTWHCHAGKRGGPSGRTFYR
jgi:hypothetical protein